MQVTRTINGKPVSDDEINRYRITNDHVVTVLYQALRRANKRNEEEAAIFPLQNHRMSVVEINEHL